jgi:hypothetical protein
MIDKRKWIFTSFLFVLFCSYTVNITCFVHSHIVDGHLVTHSHPYKGTPDNPGHCHTTAQFIYIALLSHFDTLVATFACPVHVFFGKTVIRKFSCAFFYEHIQIHPYALRAPPIL